MKPRRAGVLRALAFLLLAAAPLFAQEAAATLVTIEHARHTDYEKDPAGGNETIVLTGNVSMTVERGGTRLTVAASSVRYDRRTSMLFAQGDVSVTSHGAGGSQNMTASSMLLNTDTLEGIFDNSRIVRYGEKDSSIPGGSTLVASSRILGAGPAGSMAFKHATISFCDDDDNPHWKIRASRAWMLPGGEFAFLNALLFVGPVPLLYLPAFYYPKDELVFNPVIGMDARKGYFLQTTTYLWGRKPLSAYGNGGEDGSFSFGRPAALKEQEREGLVLHNLDKDYTGPVQDYLKLTADYYSRLGGMLGLDGKLTPRTGSFLPSLSGFLDVAFSNTVFYYADEEQFSRYGLSAEGMGRSPDSSSFLGLSLPFRYGGNLSLSGGRPLDYSLSLPLYSDPYVLVDYGSRSEYMDWIQFLTRSSDDGIRGEMKATDDDSRFVSGFSWDAKASYSFPGLRELASPFLSAAGIRVSSSVLFNSWKRTDAEFQAQPSGWRLYSPERTIFYPSLVTPVRLEMDVEGSFFQFPRPESSGGSGREAADAEGPQAEGGPSGRPPAGAGAEGLFTEDDLPLLADILLPPLAEFKGVEYRLGYALRPRYVTQDSYSAAMLFRENTDFDRKKLFSSYYELDVPFDLTNNLSYRGSFLSLTNTLSFEPHYQRHPSLAGYTDESSRESVLNADYGENRFDMRDGTVVSFRPFVYDSVLYDSGLDWKSSVRLLRTEYTGEAKSPAWDYLPANLGDDESVTENTLSAYLAAREGGRTSQKFTASLSLPPRAGERDFMVDLTFPHVDASFSAGVERVETRDGYGDKGIELREKPFRQSLTVSLLKSLRLNESLSYNMEEGHYDFLKLSLSWSGFQAAYSMQYAYGYDYDPLSGWIAGAEKEFRPYSLTFSYDSPDMKFRYWRRRIAWAPSLQTSFVYNLVKPTESYFSFVPAMTFRINQFLYLTFSSESRNSVVFRYFEDFTEYGAVMHGEKNPLADLASSFAFWDMDRRKASGFKVKNVKMTLAHNLHDWTFASSYIFKPRLVAGGDGGKSVYSYDPSFSFIVSWRPLSGLRTQVVDDYGEVQLNP